MLSDSIQTLPPIHLSLNDLKQNKQRFLNIKQVGLFLKVIGKKYE